MADAVAELCSWQGERVTVADVGAALERLRGRQERTAVRTSVVTLVALATDAAEEERAEATVRRLGGRHPGRTIVVRCVGTTDEGAPARLDAEVVLEGATAEGVDVWWEEARLRVSGALGRHLDSLVEPLILPDLPVALWFVGRLPESDDPLLAAADVVLVDSKEAPDHDPFPAVERLLRRHPVVDLSWVRTRPWRVLLAALFDGDAYRPFLERVTAATVAGKPGPRRLLAGWLASRLTMPPGAVHLEEHRHVQLRLAAGGDAVFEVGRREGERVVRASARVEGGPHHDDVLSLPDDSLPWSLGEALTHLQRDRGYEQAVHALLGLGVPGTGRGAS